MKKLAGLFTGLLLLLQVGGAFAQTSDFEIIDSFKKKSQALLTSIKAAQDPARCVALGQEIGRMEAAFAPNAPLLAEGLYPETFASSIAMLRDQLQQATRRVTLVEEAKKDRATIQDFSRRVEADTKTIAEINQQNAEYRASLDKLTVVVNELSAQIQKLTDENTGLLEKVSGLQRESKKDKASIAQLKQLTEKLNANIKDRDALVLKMMDSVFGDYAKADLTDEQKQQLFVNVQGSDYVGKIVATVDGNVKYSDKALFSAEDAKLIREEQQKLSAKWEELKPFVSKLYPDEATRVRDIATVDTRVADWKKSIDDTTWKSIHQVFVAQKLNIGPFANAGEFHAQVLAYIDGQLRNPSRATYRTFRDKVWNTPIKDKWLPTIPTEELTAAQRGEIEARIAQWDKAISSIVRKWVLIGVLGAALLVVIVVLLTRKKKTTTPTTPA